jgi:hypothetical protein
VAGGAICSAAAVPSTAATYNNRITSDGSVIKYARRGDGGMQKGSDGRDMYEI